MKFTWLGQAGLYLEIGDVKILIDPYLSNSVEKVNPQNFRRVPVDSRFLALAPDLLVFTHDHLDHYDPETVEAYLTKEGTMTVLCPGTCWQKARACGGNHNYVLFDSGTQWTEKGVRLTAVPAVHSDPYAIGVVISWEGKNLYITGDTLYSQKILRELPGRIDWVFLPINGAGNNMNMADAARFAADCGAKTAIPIHWGMFDELDPQAFPFERKVIPRIYTDTELT